MKQGRRLGVDFGDVRVGLAMSDISGLLASPLITLKNEGVDDLAGAIAKVAHENEVVAIYLGLPIHLSGNEGNASGKSREFALSLQKLLPESVTLRFIDERLSTTQAQSAAIRAGNKVSKENIDQLAAVVILENALHSESLHNTWAGKPVI